MTWACCTDEGAENWEEEEAIVMLEERDGRGEELREKEREKVEGGGVWQAGDKLYSKDVF